MKRLLFISLLFLVGKSGFGQNLVPDPSIEDTTKCPASQSNGCIYDVFADCTTFWFQPTCASSDYFHQCVSFPIGVPLNYQTPNQPARTGSAYAGIFVTGALNYREYITSALLVPLTAGNTYYAEVYVIPVCGTFIPPCLWAFSDGMGILFTQGLPDTTGVSWSNLPYIPQVENLSGNMLSDTVNWTKISGTFVAAGGENYITIGNFKDDANTQGSGFYFIDDVLVMQDTTVRIMETITASSLTIYPNPTGGKFQIQSSKSQIEKVQIYDLFGRLVLRTNEPQVDMNGFAKGVYVLRVGEATRKIILQ